MTPASPVRTESRVLGRTLPELGYELLLEVVDDAGGLGLWAQTLLWHRATMNPGRRRRQRDVFPLPLPVGICERVGAALKFRDVSSAFTAVCGKARGADALAKLKRDLGVEIWVTLQVISLNYFATGCSEAAPSLSDLRPMQAQRDALARIRTRAVSFCSPDPGVSDLPRGPSEPWDTRCDNKKLSYAGELVTAPLLLTAAQVEPGLPPLGLGGCSRLIDHLRGDIRWYMTDPSRCLLPEDQRPEVLPRTKVHVESDEEWTAVVRLMLQRNIARFVPDHRILRHRGKRVMHGAFMVTKPGKVLRDGRLVGRLIMDVRQLNALMMILEGDLDSMALPSQFLSLVLESGDVLLIGGEDLVSSFYLCLLEDGWPEHFVFEKPVEGLDFGLPAGPHRIGACVLPMGFSGATGCLQSWHRTIATEAAEDPRTHEVREALALDREFRRDRPAPYLGQGSDSMWSIYLDDFTDMVVSAFEVALALVGKPSVTQEKLRLLYAAHGVPRNQSKAIESALTAERLGYSFDGVAGWLGLLNARSVKIVTLAVELLHLHLVPLLPLQILLGLLGHGLQARRALWSYLNRAYALADGSSGDHRPRVLMGAARREILGIVSLLPMCGTDLRSPVDGCITASDACESGLGVSRSVGLTAHGTGVGAAMDKCGDGGVLNVVQGPFYCEVTVVLFSVFDGIGGFRRSLQRLRVRVVLVVCVELEATLRRVVKAAFPGCVELSDIRDVTRRLVEQVLSGAKAAGAELCIYGGGFPCQDVSRLAKLRAGITGARSSLFLELARVGRDVQELCTHFELEFLGLAECVRMEVSDEVAVTAELGWSVVYHCPSGASRVRRPRTFWCSTAPVEASDVVLEPSGRGVKMTLLGEPEPDSLWTTPGWVTCASNDPEWRLPTFTRAIPRVRPALAAPGLWEIDEVTRQRYYADGFRFPPYTYRPEFCLGRVMADGHSREPETLRVCRAVEREVLLGFVPHHTKPMLGRAARKSKDSWLDDSDRCAALGNSFHTLSTCMLIAQCLRGLGHSSPHWSVGQLQADFEEEVKAADLLRPRDREDVEGPDGLTIVGFGDDEEILPALEVEEASAVRSDFFRGLSEQSTAPLSAGQGGRSTPEVRLVEHFVRRVDARGSDVRLDIGQVFRAKPQARVGVDSTRWKWKHVLAKKVKPKLHINVLELAAVSLTVRWRMRSRPRSGRFLHLCDSQVCLAVLTKGRTASGRLRGGLRRIGARLVAGGLVPTYAFVGSEKNPADAPSRQT